MGLVNAVFKDCIATTPCPKCEDAGPGEPCDNGPHPCFARLDLYRQNLGDEYQKRIDASGPVYKRKRRML